MKKTAFLVIISMGIFFMSTVSADTDTPLFSFNSSDQCSIIINPDLSFKIPSASYDTGKLLGLVDLWVEFSYVGEQSGTLLWELKDVGTNPPVSCPVTIKSDFSFSLPTIFYDAGPLIGSMILSADFTYFGEQNSSILWQLDKIAVKTSSGLQLDKSQVVLQKGNSDTVNISGGNGDYSVTGGNTQVAEAVISGSSLEITGISDGSTMFAVEDTAGNTASLNVAVNDITQQITIAQKTITIDGNFDDWANITPVLVDDENDKDPDANFSGTDIKSFSLAKDAQFLYMMIELYDGSPRTESTTVYQFQANQAQYKADTPGDIFIGAYTSPDPGKYTVAVNQRPKTPIIDYPSTYMAAGNNRIEWKAELSQVGDLHNKFIRVYTHVLDLDNNGNLVYPISDSNNFPFEISILDPGKTPDNTQTCFSIPKKTITIDGQFDDWAGVPVFIQDKLDETTGSFEDDIDKVFIAMDSEHIYFRIDLRSDGGDFNLFSGNVRFESYDPSIGLERWFTFWFGKFDPMSGIVEIMNKWNTGVEETIKNYPVAYGSFKDNQLEYKVKLSDTTDFDISGKFMEATLFNSDNPLHGDGTKNALICD